MCRHIGYIGPPVALSDVISEFDHSLVHQSYQARELLTGTVCADGYGIGWYPDDGGTAARYAFPGPIWSDHNLATMATAVRSHTIVAAVRNATIAGENTEANCAPFQSGKFLGSLNGYLQDFGPDWKADFAAGEPRGSTDGEWIFQSIIHGDVVQNTQEICRRLLDRAADLGRDAQLNLMLSDGDSLVATRCGNMEQQNSLYVLNDGQEFPGSTLLASEPIYDDAMWEPVGDNTLIVAKADAPLVRLQI